MPMGRRGRPEMWVESSWSVMRLASSESFQSKERLDGVIKFHVAAVDEDGEAEGGEDFGDGADFEEGPAVGGALGVGFSGVAEGEGVSLAVLDDADGEGGEGAFGTVGGGGGFDVGLKWRVIAAGSARRDDEHCDR